MWTFRCPPGGHFTVFVDTRDDTDRRRARIDPLLEVVDGNGDVVAVADDERECTYRPLCGFACPELVDEPCGVGEQHSLIVRDFGAARATNNFCQNGGGYELVLRVFTSTGFPLSQETVELGGGAFRRLPRWVQTRVPAVGSFGPVLDDEDVPNKSNVTK